MKFPFKLSRPILMFVLILALASQACAISLFENPFPSNNPTSPPPGTAPTPMPRAEVKFIVQLPEPLAQNEVLAISVLDEVTGLELNFNDYQMTQVDPITYTATFPIPDQAIVKYRYVRRAGSRILEDTNSDATIRYRTLYVNGPLEVVDTVSSWTDKPANTISGSIFGTVTLETGEPLAEIMVTAGGVQTLTDSAGRFTLTGLRAGPAAAEALQDGYGRRLAPEQLEAAMQLLRLRHCRIAVPLQAFVCAGTALMSGPLLSSEAVWELGKKQLRLFVRGKRRRRGLGRGGGAVSRRHVELPNVALERRR